MTHQPDDIDDFDDRPSKSERKRNAHEAQALGEELVKLKELDLKAFDLPESLYDAIVEARRLTSRAALVRQRQLIGKLMRGIDLEPIRTALASRGEQAARDAQRFKRIEHWRDRLIAEGAPALDELMKLRPGGGGRGRKAETGRRGGEGAGPVPAAAGPARPGVPGAVSRGEPAPSARPPG
jgi:ribosome-associated protein